MSARRLMLIDNDDGFHRMLHEQLGRYGFEIYRVDENADALSRVRDIQPELIFIAVEEPDKLGYSLCNKAKKSVAKSIPVILTTQSVDAAGFNSHRKLKVHADEYLDKRVMTAEELLTKIDALLGLGEAQAEDEGFEAFEVEELDIEEVSELDAALIEVDDDFGDFGEEGDQTRIAPPQIMVDDNIAAETDAAFAALTDDPAFDNEADAMFASLTDERDELDGLDGLDTAHGDGADAGPPSPEEPPQQPESAKTQPGATPRPESAKTQPGAVAEATPEPLLEDIEVETSHAIPEAIDAPFDSEPTLAPGSPAALDLGLAAVAEMAEEEQSEVRDRRNLQQVLQLERENQRLKNELEIARKSATAASDGSPFSREREFLNLREIINKKEREILDLRDEVGLKDRDILAGKEQIRQLQHGKAEIEGKTLELEQKLLAQSESSESFAAKVAELEGKHDQLAAQAATEAEAAEQALEALKGEHRAEVEKLDLEYTQGLADLRAQTAREDEEREQRHVDALARLEADHRQQMLEREAELSRISGQALDKLRGEHDEALKAGEKARAEAEEKARAAHEQALAAQAAQHRQALDAARGEAEQAAAARAKEHADAIAQLEAKHAQAFTEQAEAHQRAIDDLHAAHADELTRRDQDRDSALEQAHEQAEDRLAAERADLQGKHDAVVADLERERGQLEEGLASARARIEELEGELAAAREQAKKTIAARDATIEEHLTTIAKRDDRIAALEADVAELEGQNTDYQEQVLKAYQKIKSDEQAMDKAKKALSIALTLLDEAAPMDAPMRADDDERQTSS